MNFQPGQWIRSLRGSFGEAPVKIIAEATVRNVIPIPTNQNFLLAVPKGCGFPWSDYMLDAHGDQIRRQDLCPDNDIRHQFNSYVKSLEANEWEILEEDYG